MNKETDKQEANAAQAGPVDPFVRLNERDRETVELFAFLDYHQRNYIRSIIDKRLDTRDPHEFVWVVRCPTVGIIKTFDYGDYVKAAECVLELAMLYKSKGVEGNISLEADCVPSHALRHNLKDSA